MIRPSFTCHNKACSIGLKEVLTLENIQSFFTACQKKASSTGVMGA